MSLVSVIIPTYNRSGFVKEAISSVLSQTYSDFELILVDDGSTDNTKEVISPYLDRIRYVYQANKGVSSARNLGIKLAKGKYIAFLDSDDLWKKEKLQIQVEFMEENRDILITYTDEIWIRNGVRVNPGKRHKKWGGWIFEHVLPLCIISPSSVMIERSVFSRIGLFDENLPACEDYDFWLRVAKHYKIHFIERPLIIKRGGHSDQLSRAFWGLDRFRVIALEKLLSSDDLSGNERSLVLKHLREKCNILAKGCFKRGKIDEGRFYQSIPERYEGGNRKY